MQTKGERDQDGKCFARGGLLKNITEHSQARIGQHCEAALSGQWESKKFVPDEKFRAERKDPGKNVQKTSVSARENAEIKARVWESETGSALIFE